MRSFVETSHELLKPDGPSPRCAPIEAICETSEDVQIALDGLCDARTLHLHYDITAVVKSGGVRLRDRCRTKRGLFESGKDLIRRSDVSRDNGARGGKVSGRRGLLEWRKFVRDGRRYQLRLFCHRLP
jgi:hypothetical protein